MLNKDAACSSAADHRHQFAAVLLLLEVVGRLQVLSSAWTVDWLMLCNAPFETPQRFELHCLWQPCCELHFVRPVH